MLPFNPLNEIQNALKHQGFYPTIKVLGESLPALPEPMLCPPDQVDKEESSDDEDEDWVDVEDEDAGSDDERSIMSFFPDSEDESEEEWERDIRHG